MFTTSESPINALVTLSRLVSEVNSPNDVLPHIIDAAVNICKADGAAVFEITKEHAEVELVASKDISRSLSHFRPESGLVGSDFVKNLLIVCEGEFAHAHPFPMIFNKDLFGTMVLLFKKEMLLSEEQVKLTEAMVNLSAVAFGKADQYSKMEKAYVELKTSQEILIKNEKLRALGEMSASISHDLNNLLSPISLQMELLKRVTGENPQAIKMITKFEKSIKRMIDTTQRLRNFSRQNDQSKQVEIADLNVLMKEAIEIVAPKTKSKMSLNLELMENLPLVHILTSDFISAIVNLLFNAIDVLGDEGEITIRSGVSNGGAWVQVQDNGPGMPDAVKNKVFEPFFTTKGEKGTGLGLSMVKSFVEEHTGKVSLESQVGKGTTFTLWFPSSGAFH